MSEVYVVTHGCYSDYRIDSIFTNKELAEAYVKELEKVTPEPSRIEIYETDVIDVDLKARQYWTAWIDLFTGEIECVMPFKCDKDTFALAKSNQRVGFCFDIDSITDTFWNTVQFQSFVSKEHAIKLAVEAHQEFLRKFDLSKIVKDNNVYRIQI